MKAYIITFWLGSDEVEHNSVVIANDEEEAKQLVAEKLRDDSADVISDEYLDIPSWQSHEMPIAIGVLEIFHNY